MLAHAAIEDDDEVVDEEGVEAKDIELVMTQVRPQCFFVEETSIAVVEMCV